MSVASYCFTLGVSNWHGSIIGWLNVIVGIAVSMVLQKSIVLLFSKLCCIVSWLLIHSAIVSLLPNGRCLMAADATYTYAISNT